MTFVVKHNHGWMVQWSGVVAIACVACQPTTAQALTFQIESAAEIFARGSLGQAHASSIVETANGLVATWYAGPTEGNSNVEIYVSRNLGSGWSTPVSVATGIQPSGPRVATWNPVLFYTAPNELRLFYKVGANTSIWYGEERTSNNNGVTWSAPVRTSSLVTSNTSGIDYIGPDKNKPVRLSNGDILSPSATVVGGWKVHFGRSSDNGQTWQVGNFINSPAGSGPDVIQPTLLQHSDGRLQALMRDQNRQNIMQSWSSDNGLTWSAVTPTSLPNNSSGIDAATLKDGSFLLVYNPVTSGRSPLTVAHSVDGLNWQNVLSLENTPGREFSYPAVIQASNGLVHITYTYSNPTLRETIKHVVISVVPEPSSVALVLLAVGSTFLCRFRISTTNDSSSRRKGIPSMPKSHLQELG